MLHAVQGARGDELAAGERRGGRGAEQLGRVRRVAAEDRHREALGRRLRDLLKEPGPLDPDARELIAHHLNQRLLAAR